MRISELSAVSGVSIPTIKFYLREGLLAPGTPTAVNHADYGDNHLRRLRVIRALTEIGGVRLRDVRRIVEAIDDERLPRHELLGVAQYALEGGSDDEAVGVSDPRDARLIDAALEQLGWTVHGDAPARGSLARALASLRALGWHLTPEDVVRYGAAIDDLAAREVSSLSADSRGEAVERLVTGTVLFEAVLTALRRLAQEHHSAATIGQM